MDFSTVLVLIAVLVCPISMGAMMWMMRKDMQAKSGHEIKTHHTAPMKVLPDEEQQR